MNKLLLVLLIGLAPFVGFCQKPTPEDEKAVFETEYSWCQAYLKGDTAALAEIEADGFTLTDPRGVTVTKDQEIAELKSGVIRFIELSSHEISLRVYGDTAVVTGRTVLKAIEDNEPHDGIFQFTDTFVRQDGRWRVATEQVTRLAATALSATEPMPREQAWVDRHDGFVEIAKKGNIGVLFLGDSITDNWRKPEQGLSVWEKNFVPLHAVNFGISGDRTQHVLWRMQNGELTGYKPRVVVLMIGTNNTGLERDRLTPRNTTEEIVSGVTAVVKGLATQWPETKILLLAIFPRAEKPTDPARLQINDVNSALARLHDGKQVFFLNIGPKFLAADGTLPKEIMPDFLHPSTKGYEIWAGAIREPLAKLMK
jgi:lysophospholipase L1-like esterase/ketosteroid isomerase-like protein